MSTDQKLTQNQSMVLDVLRKTCRRNAGLYKGKCQNLYERDLENIELGDHACVLGLGGLTFQVGSQAGISANSVLSTFKALERKGLVIRETGSPEYQRPLYWWPVGFAAELQSEIVGANP